MKRNDLKGLNCLKSIIIFILICCAYTTVWGQHLSFSSYNNETEIRAAKSITLTDGFYIPAGKTVRIFTAATFQQVVNQIGQPSSNQNYISTKIFKEPNVTKENINDQRNVYQVSQTVEYFDGLGRPLQSVQVQGSPDFKDIVVPVAYDAFGRENKKYLPYAASTGINGTYRADAFNAQQSFYNSPPAGVALIFNSAFSETKFEASPLNRVEELGSPGLPWQLSSGHTVKFAYGTNNSNTDYSTGFAVRLYNAIAVTATGQKHERILNSTGFYAANQLYLTISKDENWKDGDGKAGTSEEYKDKQGQVVLKRTFNKTSSGSIETLSTYYVYDDFGNLSFVLPPGANPDAGSISQVALDNYCYQYRYDGRKRLIEKRVPGTLQWSSMVYNKLDQLVLSQDANQKGAGKWLYSKYDAFGRVVSTGIYNSSLTRGSLQTTMDGNEPNEPLWESRNTGPEYSNLAFPTSGTDVQTVNYYDDYSFLSDNVYSYAGKSEKTKGLLTGAKVKVLGTQTMLLEVNYYDNEARLVKNFKQHYLDGTQNAFNYDETESTYNFAGELTASTRVHHEGAAKTTIANRYENDHMGRKLATFQSINGAEELVLNKMDYNQVGQLLKKSVHGTDDVSPFLQHTNYAYNERGWLKNSTSNEFSQQLKYENGTVPQFNGNISNQLWGTAGNNINEFSYSYDKLNRLTSAISTGVTMNESLTYDVMGNIISLSRDGQLGNYAYNGNKLTQLTGTLATGAYGYDANGNAITDGRNGMNLTYNFLNLPETASKAGVSLAYTYDAAGNKLKKTSSHEGIRNYINGIEYNGTAIDIIHTEEGVARRKDGGYSYEYNLSDHLGNVRVSFYKNPVSNNLEVLQRDDYYAFGLRKNNVGGSNDNKYLYNGKELQQDLGQYDYGARFYDPVIGRWNVIDPLSETDRKTSPYTYVFNNPLRFIDPTGMKGEDWYESEDKKTVKWFEGSGKQEGFNHVGAAGQVKTKGADNEVVNLNANGIATNASTGEAVTSSISGNTQIISKENALLDNAGQASDLTGGVTSGLAATGLTRFGNNGSLYFETPNGGVFNGNQYVSTTSLTKLGSNIGKYAGPVGYAIGAGQIGYGVYQDGGSFGSNTKVATAGVVGGMAGAWAGAAVGAKGGAAVGGAIGVFFFGAGAAPGAAIGGFIGGVGGGITGGYYGSEAAKKLVR